MFLRIIVLISQYSYIAYVLRIVFLHHRSKVLCKKINIIKLKELYHSFIKFID